MGRERVGFSEQQLLELREAALGSRDGARRSRYQAVWLYGQGYAVQAIERLVGGSRSSLMEWCRSYRRAGVAGLVDGRRGGNRARLSVAQLAEVRERLHTLSPAALFGAAAHTPDGQYWSIADFQRALRQWYGVSYSSRGSYHRLLHQCGFSYQRATKVYQSRAERQIAAFEEQLKKTDRCGAASPTYRAPSERRGRCVPASHHHGGVGRTGTDAADSGPCWT